MQWLLHGTLDVAVGEALRRHEDTPHALVELGLPEGVALIEIVKGAQIKQWDIMTNDAGLAQAVFDADLFFQRSIVYLQLEGGAVEQDDAVDRLFDRYKRMSPGRLYTVTASRVKVRQLPSR